MKNSNQKWFIIAGILIVVFLAILLFSNISNFRDRPQSEADYRIEKLEDLRAQYPTENDLNTSQRVEKLQDLSDETKAPNDLTVDERKQKLKQLQDNN